MFCYKEVTELAGDTSRVLFLAVLFTAVSKREQVSTLLDMLDDVSTSHYHFPLLLFYGLAEDSPRALPLHHSLDFLSRTQWDTSTTNVILSPLTNGH